MQEVLVHFRHPGDIPECVKAVIAVSHKAPCCATAARSSRLDSRRFRAGPIVGQQLIEPTRPGKVRIAMQEIGDDPLLDLGRWTFLPGDRLFSEQEPEHIRGNHTRRRAYPRDGRRRRAS